MANHNALLNGVVYHQDRLTTAEGNTAYSCLIEDGLHLQTVVLTVQFNQRDGEGRTTCTGRGGEGRRRGRARCIVPILFTGREEDCSFMHSQST